MLTTINQGLTQAGGGHMFTPCHGPQTGRMVRFGSYTTLGSYVVAVAAIHATIRLVPRLLNLPAVRGGLAKMADATTTPLAASIKTHLRGPSAEFGRNVMEDAVREYLQMPAAAVLPALIGRVTAVAAGYWARRMLTYALLAPAGVALSVALMQLGRFKDGGLAAVMALPPTGVPRSILTTEGGDLFAAGWLTPEFAKAVGDVGRVFRNISTNAVSLLDLTALTVYSGYCLPLPIPTFVFRLCDWLPFPSSPAQAAALHGAVVAARHVASVTDIVVWQLAVDVGALIESRMFSSVRPVIAQKAAGLSTRTLETAPTAGAPSQPTRPLVFRVVKRIVSRTAIVAARAGLMYVIVRYMPGMTPYRRSIFYGLPVLVCLFP